MGGIMPQLISVTLEEWVYLVYVSPREEILATRIL